MNKSFKFLFLTLAFAPIGCMGSHHAPSDNTNLEIGKNCVINVPDGYVLSRSGRDISYSAIESPPGNIAAYIGNFSSYMNEKNNPIKQGATVHEYGNFLVVHKIDNRGSRPVEISRIIFPDSMLVITGRDAHNYQSFVDECISTAVD